MANLRIKVGSYTGTGSDNNAITSVGFPPDLVIVKTSGQHPMIKTKSMYGDLAQYFGTALAGIANTIQELTATGFVVGTDATVNTGATTYYYVAIQMLSGQSYMRTGAFYGNGADNYNYTDAGIAFTPDIAYIKANTTQQATLRTASITTDNSFHVIATADASNEIQSILANGFQVGSSGRSNSLNQYMHYFVAKHLSKVITSGVYTGTGASQSITGLGFAPDIVFVKNTSTGVMVMKTTTMGTNVSMGMSNSASGTTNITSLDTDGFTVGAGTDANANGLTHYYIAFKAGDFNAPIIRTSI